MRYVCSRCGQAHDELPDLGFDVPDCAEDVPAAEQAARVLFDEDICVVDGELFFIRGVLEIPVHDTDETFGLGVWVSQMAENFETYLDSDDSSAIGPFSGLLGNEIMFGGEPTLNLKAMAHFRREFVPTIELESTDHPLAVVQRKGMSLDAVWAFVHERSGPCLPDQ